MSLPKAAYDTFVIVTGAASGIGYELARQLAQRGHHLFLVDRAGEKLGAVATELRNRHRVEVTAHVCDLAVERQREELIAAVDAEGRALVGLCNNAGVFTIGNFHELPYERESAELAVDAVAVHHLCGALLPGMVARGTGAVLNTTSLAANQPMPRGATYAASKAFTHTFSECVAAELWGTGVSCTSLQPATTRTNIVREAGAEAQVGILPDFVWADAADVARVGIEAMIKGKRTAVPGLFQRTVGVAVGRHVPRGLWLRAWRIVMDRMLPDSPPAPGAHTTEGPGAPATAPRAAA